MLLAPVPLATMMSASKLILYFSRHPTIFGFQSSTPPDIVTLTSVNREADHNFRLALVLLLMSLLKQSNSSLTLELPLLIFFPLYPILMEELYLCPKYVNYFSRFMAFWTMLCPNELGTQLVF